MFRLVLLIGGLSSAPVARAFAPADIFVDAGAVGVQNGSSWQDAFVHVGPALASAVPGTRILIAGGTYKPDGGSGDRSATFVVNSGVILEGGYAGSAGGDPNLRDPAAYVTTLSGDIGVSGVSTDNSYHVVTLSAGGAPRELNGLVIAWGNADGIFPDDTGSAIRCLGPAMIRNCLIRDSRGDNGGAVFVPLGVSPEFENCQFNGNSTFGTGGAISLSGGNSTLTGCAFANNMADFSGGAIGGSNSTFTLTDCVFLDNVAGFFGGAVYHFFGSPQVTGCLFQDNVQLNDTVIGNDGGGAFYNDRGNAVIRRTRFQGNLATDDGGAMFATQGATVLESCRFIDNLAGDFGGAIHNLLGSLIVRNSALVANTGFDRGGGISNSNASLTVEGCSIVNNRCFVIGGAGIHHQNGAGLIQGDILWYNRDLNGQSEAAQVKVVGPLPTTRFNCMQGWTGLFGGTGNFSGNPKFVNLDGPDGIAGTADDCVEISVTSPCINTGDPILVVPPEAMEIDGQPRIMGCRIDVGADEFLVGEPGSGDMNGDGRVDGADIQPFVNAFLGVGPAAWFCVADLDSSGFLDPTDVAMMADLLLSLARSAPATAMSY